MKLLFISGKGGVGKTVMAAAIAECCAVSADTLIVSLNQPSLLARYLDCPIPSNEPFKIDKNLWVLHLDRNVCLNDFIRNFLKVGIISKWIFDHPLYPFISATAPGIHEFLIMDRIVSFAIQSQVPIWQHIIIDTPATGHLLNLLSITQGLRSAIKHGPLRSRISKIDQILTNSEITKILIVTIPEKQPIEETLHLLKQIKTKVKINNFSLILNMFPQYFFQHQNSSMKNSSLFRKHENTLSSKIHLSEKLLLQHLEKDIKRCRLAEFYKKKLECFIENTQIFQVPYIPAVSEYQLTKDISSFLKRKLPNGFY